MTLPTIRRSLAAVALATALAVAATGCGARDVADTRTQDVAQPSRATTATTATSAAPSERPERGRVELPLGSIVGEWAEQPAWGDALVLRTVDGKDEVAYSTSVDDQSVVSIGWRVGGRLLRTATVLVAAADGITLYGGDRIDDDGVLGAQPGEGPTYRLYGVVPGQRAITITAPDAGARRPTAASSTVLPGYTVFYDVGSWRDGWDPLQLAPVAVTTDDGRSADVRTDSYA